MSERSHSTLCVICAALLTRAATRSRGGPKDALCLSFPGCKSRDRGAPSELRGAGSVESSGRCLELQTPLERSSCQGRREGWLPAALAPHSWVEGAGGRHRAGGDSVWGSHSRTRRCRGGQGALQGLAWDLCCLCRWPGETSLQERLKGKLFFRHLKGCKARGKCLLGGS